MVCVNNITDIQSLVIVNNRDKTQTLVNEHSRAGASIASEAMMHLPSVSDFFPISRTGRLCSRDLNFWDAKERDPEITVTCQANRSQGLRPLST